MSPSQSTVHNSLGNCLVATGDDDTARYHYAMAIHFDQKNTGAWINLAVISERLKMDEEAISAYEQAIEYGARKSAVYNQGRQCEWEDVFENKPAVFRSKGAAGGDKLSLANTQNLTAH